MSDILEVWIRKEYIPADELKNYPSGDTCIKVFMDKTCVLCNKVRTVSKNFLGSKNEGTSFYDVCRHSVSYQSIYANRIKTIGDIVVGSVSISRADPKTDGMKCSGVCGQWIHMAQANQKNNTFKCWSCRTRGW